MNEMRPDANEASADIAPPDESSRIRLDRLTGRQLEILREEMNDWLVAKADDLPPDGSDDARSQAEEVAALGRTVSGLRRGELAPDPVARRLVARTVGETRRLDELREEYEPELAAHEAWVALLSHLDSAGGEEAPGPGCGSPDEDDCEDGPSPGCVQLADRLSEDQIRIVRREVTGTLAGRAGDLHLLVGQPDAGREIDEVAALARMAHWLERGDIELPDPSARRMAERLVGGSRDLNEWEELRERYEAGLAEEEALVAFARLFSDTPARR